ncbi:MAG: MMPL family transporter [Acidobacteriota bacterium]|nr:MMPL family transporter [Acidobacteriota bacterium]
MSDNPNSADPIIRISLAAIGKPRLSIIVALFIILAAAPGLLRLEIKTDGRALLPRGHEALKEDARIREEYGLRDMLMVVLTTTAAEDIYNPTTCRLVDNLTRAMKSLPGIDGRRVYSLATERRDRVYTGSMEFRPFLDPLPETRAQLDTLRGDIAATDLVMGTLVSHDHRSTVILAGLPTETGDRTRLYLSVVDLVSAHADDVHRVEVVGAPAAETLLGRHIIEDLTVILPICITLMGLVLYLGCRRIWGVLLGLSEVGACLVFTFGIMGWFGVPVYLTTAVLPVILTTVGLADEIHLFWRYQQILATESSDRPVHLLMRQMARPIVLTSLTTSIGFLSFLTAPLAVVRIFGLFAAIGILFCLVWSLTVVPAVLQMLPEDRLRRPLNPRGFIRTQRAYRYPRTTQILLGILVLALGSGIYRLYVQDSWIDGFSPDSEFAQATNRVNEGFYGTHVLLLELVFPPLAEPLAKVYHGPSGPLLVPENLAVVGALERFIRELPGVGGVMGPHGQLTTTAFLRSGRQERLRAIPPEPPEIAILFNRLEQVRGEARRRELIDDKRESCIVTIFLKNANYLHTKDLMEQIETRVTRTLPEARFAFAGDVAVSQAMIPLVVHTQMTSLLTALAFALLIAVVFLRKPQTALSILVPTAAAVAAGVGLMGWTGIPLGVATSMFCAITLGIGLDYSIHFHAAWARAVKEGADAPASAALQEAGPAIAADSLAVTCGFGLLMISQVPANTRLGFLVAVALLGAALFTCLGLGAYLAMKK